MKDFVYTAQPSRVVFGAGSLSHLEREIDRSRHHKLVNRRQIARLRRGDPIEARAGELTEWP